MNSKSEKHQVKITHPRNRAYHAPRIFVYGAMRELTAAGTGASVESNPGGQCKGVSGTMLNPNFERC